MNYSKVDEVLRWGRDTRTFRHDFLAESSEREREREKLDREKVA